MYRTESTGTYLLLEAFKSLDTIPLKQTEPLSEKIISDPY